MYKKNAQGWLKHIDFILWDILILQVSFILGYMIRHGWGRWPYLRTDYRILAIVLIVVDFLVAAIFNSTQDVLKRGYLKEFIASVRHVVLTLVIMTTYLFSTQTGDTYSRITLYLTSGFHLVLGYGIRVLWKPVVRQINKGKPKDKMILVAEEAVVPDILKRTSEWDNFQYSGLVLSDRQAKGEVIEGLKVVADLEDAADYICREWVDEVFVCPEHLSDLKTGSRAAIEDFISDTYGIPETENTENPAEQSGVAQLIEQCREMSIPVHVGLPLSGDGGKNIIETIGGYNVLTMTSNYAGPAQLFLKRVIDIIGGVVGSVFAVIAIMIIGPKIKKESPGPVLFRQVRIGKNGKRFTFYKIRSMYMDAEERKKELQSQNRNADGMMFKLDWDPRIIGNRIVDGKQVTGIGEKIRSSSLDELPQFFNVLKGDMSLVGTRPPTEDEWEKYKYHHRARLSAKPGLTGLWQVSGRSSITDFEEVVKLDTRYINNWSLTLDIKILVKTIKAVLLHEGAL